MTRNIAVTFALAFLIFGGIGFFNARADVADPDYVREQAFKDVQLLLRPASHTVKGVGEFVYRSDGHVLYRFDLETNRLSKSSYAERLELEQGFENPVKFPIRGSLLIALLGGPTAGYTIKDLTALENLGKVRYVLAGLLGGVSGFTLGYKLGTLRPLSPRSPELRALIEDEKEWRSYKSIYLKRVAFRIYQCALEIKEPKKREYYKVSASLFYRLSTSKTREITPLDLLWAVNTLNHAGALVSADFRRDLTSSQNSVPFWLSWWFVGAIGAFALIGIAILCRSYWRPRLRLKKEHRPHVPGETVAGEGDTPNPTAPAGQKAPLPGR
ncbi:MAG: hypothetical protein QOF89_4787 [Acidobacteriota bacterium]|jgi:hypothetical protein|nr:hypothetical protein [Acidobacteriota bacterium]